MGNDDLQICQICGGELDVTVVYCVRCKTPHHLDCWEFNGKCSTFGCKSTVFSAKAEKHIIDVSDNDHMKIDASGDLWLSDELVVVEKQKRRRKGTKKSRKKGKYKKRDKTKRRVSSPIDDVFGAPCASLEVDGLPEYSSSVLPFLLCVCAIIWMIVVQSIGQYPAAIQLIPPAFLCGSAIFLLLELNQKREKFYLDNERKMLLCVRTSMRLTNIVKVCNFDDILHIGVSCHSVKNPPPFESGVTRDLRYQYAIIVERKDRSSFRVCNFRYSYHWVNRIARKLARHLRVSYKLAHSGKGSLIESRGKLPENSIDNGSDSIDYGRYGCISRNWLLFETVVILLALILFLCLAWYQ